ncbi:Myomodulin neuropeptides like protein [Argiope bruennichi]|uniref:Myomodulin neuropeptides like protein n=1 Tax=Argiope bruennichi TaxID=94029 RepID=A0A8T0EYI5_ARGBR|nr:Myomodulin neuropeptides like protein [Argiope bruennichi]
MMRSLIVSAALLLVILWEGRVQCDFSSGGGDVSDSIPLLASGKRQHNIMRFGKRPASGHSLIHFGKRDEQSGNKGHSFLYFGKRAEGDSSIWDYLGPNRDPSYKRGHAIMRFGKRGPDSHSFIRFGRDAFSAEESNEEDKRSNGHAMMYFGKRGNGHSMMYFGKRDDASDDYQGSYGDKRAHAMIHFGKREDDDGAWEGKRAHSMIHFGKRDSDGPRKSGSHAMIHFGKRDLDDELDEIEAAEQGYWSPEMMEAKRQHNLLRFGKKDRKGSHAMIHFGKRDIDEDKRAHAMIHFGKRSADDALQGNQSNKGLSRVKREAGHPQELTLVRYEDPEEDVISSEENIRGPGLYGPEFWNPIEQQRPEEEWDPNYMEYSHPDKKDGSKNVFLRFG